MRRNVVLWGPVVAWTTLILVASTLPVARFPDLGFGAADELGHGLVYLVFGALVARASSRSGWTAAGALALAVGLALAIGGSMEIVQASIGRNASVGDGLADVVGSAIGAGGWTAIAGLMEEKR